MVTSQVWNYSKQILRIIHYKNTRKRKLTCDRSISESVSNSVAVSHKVRGENSTLLLFAFSSTSSFDAIKKIKFLLTFNSTTLSLY